MKHVENVFLKILPIPSKTACSLFALRVVSQLQAPQHLGPVVNLSGPLRGMC